MPTTPSRGTTTKRAGGTFSKTTQVFSNTLVHATPSRGLKPQREQAAHSRKRRHYAECERKVRDNTVNKNRTHGVIHNALSEFRSYVGTLPPSKLFSPHMIRWISTRYIQCLETYLVPTPPSRGTTTKRACGTFPKTTQVFPNKL